MTLKLPADFGQTPKKKIILPENMTGLLMQVCCAPCCGAVLECFKHHNIYPTLFFYNPNIHPQDEYLKRRDELIELAQLLGFAYVIPEYDPKPWFAKVKGLEHEPERGKRCTVCFTERLTATAIYAKEHGFSHFTTTLATSRWKNKKQIDEAGFAAQAATGIPYWAEDWRKEGLVTRRYQLVKSFDFYNQQYCGCVYSKISTAFQKECASPTDKLAMATALETLQINSKTIQNESLQPNTDQSTNQSSNKPIDNHLENNCHC